jgi:hypothetical protein
MLTFVPSEVTTQYKCEAFVPAELEEALVRHCKGTFVPGGASNRYKCPHLYGEKILHRNENRARDKCLILQ